MKYISFCVPCYNSASYMDHCIQTLLTGGEDVEIIIVNDGSTKDNTAEIADSYAKKYPTIVKAIHQENGGHGSGVNQGIKNATGLYYKVVDSDDWVNEEALKNVLDQIKKFHEEKNLVDMIVCNYVYEYTETNTQRVVDLKNVFPANQVITFDDSKKFKKSQFIGMHTVIYRTEILKEIKLELPKHTFYVDNVFVYVPLPHIKTMYYMHEDLYRYFIGRADQSVNESVIMKRIDQHLKVTKILIDAYDISKIEAQSKKLAKYMSDYVSILMAITSIYLIKIGDAEALSKKKALWEYLKNKDQKLYKACKGNIEGLTATNSKIGMWFCKVIYTIARKILKFN